MAVTISKKILWPSMANMNMETVEKMSSVFDVWSESTPALEGRKTDHCVSSGTSVMKILIMHRRMTMTMVTKLEVEEVEVWVNTF